MTATTARIIPLVALLGCTTADPLDDISQASTAAPNPRGHSAMVYDSQSEQFIVFGGVPGRPTRDVWTVNISGESWHRVGELPVGQAVVAAYHADLDRAVVWIPTRPRPDGGGNLEPFLHADAISETWTFDLETNTWEQVATVGPDPGVMGARMTYDAQSRKLILFGGFDYPTGSFQDKTWAFDLDTRVWTNMNPSTRPTARNFHGQTYHAAADRVVVVAGMDVTFAPTNHVWTYDYEANTWTQLAAPDAPARDYVSIAYVDDGERIVLHGGLLYGPNGEELAQSDTWELDLAGWRRVHDGSESGPRAFHAMAAAQGEDRVLMFGGGASLAQLTNETWEYRSKQVRWRQR